jgi:hypothetical protein
VSGSIRLDFEVAVRDAADLSWKAKLVGYTLKSRMKPNGWCKSGIPRLARDCSVSDNTVRAAIAELESARLLRAERASGKATEFTATPSRDEGVTSPAATPSTDEPPHFVNSPPIPRGSGGEEEPVSNPSKALGGERKWFWSRGPLSWRGARWSRRSRGT